MPAEGFLRGKQERNHIGILMKYFLAKYFFSACALVRVLKRMFVVRKDGRPQRGGEGSCLLREASS